jgi:NAD+ synthase
LALWAYNHGCSPRALAQALSVTEESATYVYRDIEAKRRTTRYLHARPALIEDISELKLSTKK